MADLPEHTAPAENSEPNGEYVRTFASDAAAVEKGQQPDFTKAEGAPHETREEILARLSAKAAQALEAQDAARTAVKDPITAARAAMPERAAPVTHASERLIEASPLHTYKRDTEDEVKHEQASTTTMLAAEGDRPSAVPELPKPVKKSSNLLIWGGVLIALGVMSAAASLWFTHSTKPVAVASSIPSRIFVDSEQEISGTGDTLAQAIVAASQAQLATGAVKMLYTAESTTTGNDIFTALNLAAPDMLLRNIKTAGSMAGIVDANRVNAPFFIISVDDYGDSDAAMWSWEPTMAVTLETLYPLYPAASATPVGTSTAITASSTPAVTPTNEPVGFVDEEIANYNARALKDGLGRTIMIYGYYDGHTLVLARDELSFATILDRLANSATQQ